MSTYDNEFFKYVNSGALVSAEEILPLLLNKLSIESVLDVGCGQGAWLSIWEKLGVDDIKGIDGSYVDRDRLLINKEYFAPHDLSEQFDLNRHFDIVQSLEVAEHLPKHSAKDFVGSLVKHGDLILFSAAPKGQGGDHHINEQEYDYWRDLFSQHNYVAIDYLRPLIINNTKIEPWYRYNTFLYASSERINTLPEDLKKHVAKSKKLSDLSPFIYKIRKKIVRLIPIYIMNRMVKIKEKIIAKQRAA